MTNHFQEAVILVIVYSTNKPSLVTNKSWQLLHVNDYLILSLYYSLNSSVLSGKLDIKVLFVCFLKKRKITLTILAQTDIVLERCLSATTFLFAFTIKEYKYKYSTHNLLHILESLYYFSFQLDLNLHF